MKGMHLLMAFVVLAVVHSLVATNSALAVTILSSPFGSAYVTVRIGANAQAPVQLVVWKRNSDGACSATTIGTNLARTTTITSSRSGERRHADPGLRGQRELL